MNLETNIVIISGSWDFFLTHLNFCFCFKDCQLISDMKTRWFMLFPSHCSEVWNNILHCGAIKRQSIFSQILTKINFLRCMLWGIIVLSHEYPGISNHWHLNCFIQQHVQYKNKENAKALHHWPFVRGIQQWLVDSPHKGPVMKKAFPCHGIFMTHRNHQRNKRLDHISSGDKIFISSMWCLDMCILYEKK